MQHSSYAWPDRPTVQIAVGHDCDGLPLDQAPNESANAAYSLHATACDLATFMAAMLSGGAKAASPTAEMLEHQVRVNERVSSGLGWGLEASTAGRAFWHWGDNPGYKCLALALREPGEGVVVMTNADGGRQLCAWIVQRLLDTDHPALAWLASRYQDRMSVIDEPRA
jgi:CubicO group peptidase (beta-lactamase class C family)